MTYSEEMTYSIEQLKLMYADETPKEKAFGCRRVVLVCLKEYNSLKNHSPNIAKGYGRDAVKFYKSMQFHRSNISRF